MNDETTTTPEPAQLPEVTFETTLAEIITPRMPDAGTAVQILGLPKDIQGRSGVLFLCLGSESQDAARYLIDCLERLEVQTAVRKHVGPEAS